VKGNEVLFIRCHSLHCCLSMFVSDFGNSLPLWKRSTGFTKKIVDEVLNSPYWANTAVFITFDEGGGYYDSGYVQPLDFFGDGTRIPLLIVSQYSKGGNVTHGYADHVSIDKFIERNWKIGTISYRSRDNFPNPITAPGNAYVPLNGPAISDLFEAFNFPN
jgi:phospholipase C